MAPTHSPADHSYENAVHGESEFVVRFEHEFGIAIIHVKANLSTIQPRAYSELATRINAVRDELVRAGYRISYEPTIILPGRIAE